MESSLRRENRWLLESKKLNWWPNEESKFGQFILEAYVIFMSQEKTTAIISEQTNQKNCFKSYLESNKQRRENSVKGMIIILNESLKIWIVNLIYKLAQHFIHYLHFCHLPKILKNFCNKKTFFGPDCKF